MQLGELQHQIDRFRTRGISIVAISVDKPKESLAMVQRLGITFDLASDPDQDIVRAFRVQNPDTQELALHAVYIVDSKAKVIYRKVARRRPNSNELIDAIDAHRGDYPRSDKIEPAQRIAVAYPTNNFQALLEVTRVQALPQSINAAQYQRVRQLAATIHSDDALIAFRRLMQASNTASLDQLLDTASFIARQTYFNEPHEAFAAGKLLRQRLNAVDELETQLTDASDVNVRDQVLAKLVKARSLLTRSRAIIAQEAVAWRLRMLKTSIRAYREVARAVHRDQSGPE